MEARAQPQQAPIRDLTEESLRPIVTRAASASATRPLKLALVSCGLGNVRRGFEISTGRWYEALKDYPGLKVKLYCGGNYPGSELIFNIPRDLVMASPLSVFKPLNPRRYWEFCYGVEQISFGLFYWMDLFLFEPDIVWTKEVPFGYFLPIYRKALGLKFKTIFANGGAFQPQTYKDFDFIQHLTQESHDQALAAGIPAEKMTTLTNIIPFHKTDETRESIRHQLGYCQNDYVVICVSAWNTYHKRLDYLIEEVAAIGDPSVKLLLCGHPDAETGALKELARHKLGDRVRFISLDERMLHRAMTAADVFVMASINECLGNSIAEAVFAGLPVITHSHAASRFILGDNSEWIVDLQVKGNLSDRLLALRPDKGAGTRVQQQQERVSEAFGARSLAPRFYEMLKVLRDGAPSPHALEQKETPTR